MGEERNVSVSEVYAFIARSSWLALLTALIAGMAAYVLSNRSPAVYEGSAGVLISAPASGLQELLGQSGGIIDSDVLVLAATTDGVLLDALLRLGVAEPTAADVRSLRQRTDSSFVTGSTSKVVLVNVTSTDADLAHQSAAAVADALIAWEREQNGATLAAAAQASWQSVEALDATITLLLDSGADSPEAAEMAAVRDSRRQEALRLQAAAAAPLGNLRPFGQVTASARQVGPTPVRNAVLAAVAGLLAGYALYFLAERTNGHLRSTDELRRLTRAKVTTLQPRDRGDDSSVERAAGIVATSLRDRFPSAQPLSVLVSPLHRVPASSQFTIGLAQAFARDGYSTLLVLTGSPTRNALRHTKLSSVPELDVSLSFAPPNRLTRAALAEAVSMAPDDDPYWLTPGRIAVWLAERASDYQVVVIGGPAGLRGDISPAAAACTTVVVTVPLGAPGRTVAAAVEGAADLGADLGAAVLVPRTGRASRPRATRSWQAASAAERVE